jgi:glycosyltransferase involved in cell wall biosynthesis
MKEILIVKSFYPLEKDPRVLKISKILEDLGYTFSFMGWNREYSSAFSYKKTKSTNHNERIMSLKAPDGFMSLPFLPFWWFFLLKWLLRSKWDALHVVNFPSVIPAIIVGKLEGKPIIYDVEDSFADQGTLPNSLGFLRLLGIWIERFCMKFVNAVVLVDELQINEFSGIPNSSVCIIYDSPRPSPTNRNTNREKGVFKIFNAGYLSRHRQLNIDAMIDAIKNVEGVKIIIAGQGDLVNEIRAKAITMPNKIQYIGWIPYPRVIELSYEADLLLSLRDPNPPVQKYICGSKFLEAIMCGKPILVNKGTSAAIKVTRHNCGIVVDAKNPVELRSTIVKLKENNDLCRILGINGRKAYESTYGWEIMKQRLLNLYSKILD